VLEAITGCAHTSERNASSSTSSDNREPLELVQRSTKTGCDINLSPGEAVPAISTFSTQIQSTRTSRQLVPLLAHPFRLSKSRLSNSLSSALPRILSPEPSYRSHGDYFLIHLCRPIGIGYLNTRSLMKLQLWYCGEIICGSSAHDETKMCLSLVDSI